MLQVPQSPKFHYTASHCRDTDHFERSAPNDPKMTSTLQGPKFHLFCSITSSFRVAGHFDTSAPNDPKMTLNSKRSKVPIHRLQVPASPKFALRQAVYELQAILRQRNK